MDVLKPIFERAGVDYTQWLALVRNSLRLDHRVRPVGRAGVSGRAAGSGRPIVFKAIFYGLYGAFLATLAIRLDDLLIAGLLVSSFVMFLVGTNVLMDHNTAMSLTADFAILGHRPVSSRTYFAARVGFVTASTALVTSLCAWPVLIAVPIVRGVAVGAAAVPMVYGAAMCTTMGLLLGYASLVRRIRPASLNNAMSFAQMILSFAVYGGFQFAGRIGSRMAQLGSIRHPWWLFLIPPAWFGSYLDVAAGRGTRSEAIASAVSLVAFAWLVTRFSGRIAAEFSGHLSDISATAGSTRRTSNAPRTGQSRRRWLFRSPEARAMALLIRGQFRSDQTFRLAVLSVLPLTLLYLFMGMRDGLTDPFDRGPSSFSLVTMAVLMFPMTVYSALARSEKFHASWIFFVTPSDRTRLVLATLLIVIVTFLAPYLLFVALVFFWFVRNLWHVAVHVGMLGLFSHLMLQIQVFLSPALPFARPLNAPGTRGPLLMMQMGLVAAAAIVLSFSATWIYQSPWRIGLIAGGVIVLGACLRVLTRARVEREAAGLEYEG